MKFKFLQLTSFISGAVIMILEVLGFRLLAPYFGSSVYVSGGLIGTVMLALAVGYYLGGVIVEKNSKPKILYKLTLVSSAYIFLIGFFYKRILIIFSNLGIVYGTLLSTLIIFGPPMILLSIVTPFIIKLISKEYEVGISAGRISSIATIGSILGTFLTTFILIPQIGSHISLYLCGVVVLIISIIGLSGKKYLIFLLLLFLFNPFSNLPEEDVIYQKESLYGFIKILDRGEQLFLVTDNNKWTQSIYQKDGSINKGHYYYFMNAAPLITDTKEVLIVGMGGGTSPKHYLDLFNVNVDGVEIDPEIVEVSYNYFGLDRNDPRLNVYIQDARKYLRETKKTYDVVQVDVYNHAHIPFHLSSKEFFEDIRDVLSDDGVVVMNLFSSFEDSEKELVNSIGYTISQVFPSVYVWDLGVNNILFATKNSTDLLSIRSKIKENKIEELDDLATFSVLIKEFEPPGNPILLTDDKSSIELMSHGKY